MKCEVCGGVMMYRSTNKITKMTKWKCKECGHLMFDDFMHVDLKQLITPRGEPKYYSLVGNTYQVKKRINKHQYYLASFRSEDMAKRFVSLMKESQWDLARVVEFKEACKV